MASRYYLKPESTDFLASLCPSPLVTDLVIKQIGIDPDKRVWTFYFSGPRRGTAEFWNELGEKIKTAVPEILHVEFEWEEESLEEYMEQVVKSFAMQPVKYSSPTPPNGNGNGNGNGTRRRRKRRAVLQAEIKGEPIPIKELLEEERNVIILGEVVAFDSRLTRTGKTLIIFDVYDGTDSISCKLFLDEPEDLGIKKGNWLKVLGNLEYQSFDNQLSIMVQSIAHTESPPRLSDDAPEKRVELHLHTKMSGLDGTIDVEDVVKLASSLGHSALAVTDHGVIQAFPDAYSAGKKYGIKILYGVEGYLINDENEKTRPFHIILIAKNQTGLKNLYRLISDSHMHYFYRRPRIPRKVLQKYREGLIVGSACEAGELYQAVLRKDPRAKEIANFYDFLEIQPLGNNEFLIGTELVKTWDDLIGINKQIIALGEELGKPVVATGDVHFLRPEDGFIRTILLAGQGFEDAERQAPLYFRTTTEMLEEFSYLGEEKAHEVVIKNPQLIADKCEELTPVPQGLHPPIIEEAEESLREMTYRSAHLLYGDPLPDIVASRLERELDSIIGNGYASLYWIAHKLVKKSLDDGYLVGSRGSVGSSLVATMCSITEVNPLPPHYVCPSCRWNEFFVKGEVGSGVDLPDRVCPTCGTPVQKLGFDIPFEVFMGFHGDKVPDIDLNFSGEYQGNVHRYTEELFGSEHVFRAGTIGTLAEKTAYGFVMKYLEQVNETRRNAEINRLVSKITGVRRTTGQHPGGMVVVPADKEVYDFTPIQYPANDPSSGTVTTHFEYHAIDDSLVKLDILGHDDPTMLRMLEDLTGVSVVDIPLDDPETMAIFSGLEPLELTEEQIGTPVGTLGIPEFGTRFVRQMLIDTRPTTFSELVRISGLSHGTNVWTNNAQDLIRSGVTDLNNAIATRDDIMVYLIHQGLESGDAFRIMEQVRKGRGLKEQDIALMKQHNVPDWYIESCNKISYMFPKAHAVAYVMMAFRIAYFKVHYPLAFYASYFSLRAVEFDAHLAAQGESAVRKEMAAISAKGNEATARERSMITTLEIVLEAMARGVRFLPVDLYRSSDRQFLIHESSLLPPFASLQGVGLNAAAAIVEARQQGEFTSIEDLRQKSGVTKAVIETLRLHGCLEGLSETNQLTLF
ncbi:MAG: PolC-type DNA polymerase III [Firmicutes bacterium]|jgi:DNA polymerase-3 subunit alpha (Gram-positive type)|nr:PolC-type DNA polymerase III [Bacillota bacterium]